MTRDDLPNKLRLVFRRDGEPTVAHDLYLRADENEGSFIYATPRSQAVNGEDMFTVYVPKGR